MDGEFDSVVSCPSCGVAIREPYILCKENTCPDVHICLSCFAKGVEFGDHQSDHSYTVVKNDFPLFDPAWTAADEVSLLEVMSDCGYGNWSDVAHRMRTKNKVEIEKHYNKHYLNDPVPELPQLQEPDIKRYPEPLVYKLCDDPPRYADPSMMFQEMAGYMAGRGDFNIEYDNFMELELRSLSFDSKGDSEDGDELEEKLKFNVLDIYQGCLKERARRKKIVRKYGLINIKKQWLHSRCYKNNYREIIEKMKVFMRLLSPMEYDKYLEALMYENEIRSSIRKLQEYIQNGISKLRNIKVYRVLQQRRQEVKLKRHLLDDIFTHMRDETACQTWLQRQAVLDTISKGGILALPNIPRRSAPPLEIEGLPGYDKLSSVEKDFCANVRFVPDAYLEFKSMLISRCQKYGYLKLQHARTLIKIDVNKTRKLYDFLLTEGLICKDPE